MTDSTYATADHISRVNQLLWEIIADLSRRASCHDRSKLEEPEKSAFDRLEALKRSTIVYGSDEYRAALAAERPAIQHHYQVNDHHPEHFPDGVAGMTLTALVEMLADWKAAGERMPGGNMHDSIEQNIISFGIEPQLARVLVNTARAFDWL